MKPKLLFFNRSSLVWDPRESLKLIKFGGIEKLILEEKLPGIGEGNREFAIEELKRLGFNKFGFFKGEVEDYGRGTIHLNNNLHRSHGSFTYNFGQTGEGIKRVLYNTVDNSTFVIDDLYFGPGIIMDQAITLLLEVSSEERRNLLKDLYDAQVKFARLADYL